MAGRPITNRLNYWSDDHRYLLAKLAGDVSKSAFRQFGMRIDPWDLIIEGWRCHLRKCTVTQLHGAPVNHAKFAMMSLVLREIKARQYNPIMQNL